MDQHTYTVPELTGRISTALQRTFPDEVWVQGEIRDLSRSRNGHVYFSLVDPGTDGRESLLPVTLFASEKFVVNRVLMRSGAGRMTDGINVRIRGRLSLYAQRSTVQLRMSWIDTDYTLGQLAADRAALIQLLKSDGSLASNGALPMPMVPLSIGLVTSAGSAAHADFLSELTRSGFGFTVMVAHAMVQGVDAPASIAHAFAALSARSLDAVALVRGGGAQTELATFDTEVVARAIAACTAPVFTGIGHETDQTIADLAAHGAFKTPTATAQALVTLVRSYVDRLDGMSGAMRRAHRSVIDRTSSRVDHASLRLQSASERHLQRQRLRLDAIRTRIDGGAQRTAAGALRRLETISGRTRRSAHHRLDTSTADVDQRWLAMSTAARRAVISARRRIDVLASLAESHDPAAMFAKGWSITYGPNGAPVRNPSEVDVADRLRTAVEGGTLSSVVIEPEEDP